MNKITANFDELVGFDYTDEKEWRTFVEDTVVPVYQDVQALCELREWMKEFSDENQQISMKDIGANENLQVILLGGLDDDLKESEHWAISSIYKEILGYTFSPEAVENNSSTPFELGDGFLWVQPPLDVNWKTSFPILSEICKKIMDKFGIQAEEHPINLKEGAEQLPAFLERFLKNLQNASINTNRKIFFVNGLNYAYLKGLKNVYPNLETETSRTEVCRLLDIDEFQLLSHADGDDEDVYTLWRHQEGGFAALVALMNSQIWGIAKSLKDPIQFFDRKGRKGFFQSDIAAHGLPLRDDYIKAVRDSGFEENLQKFTEHFERSDISHNNFFRGLLLEPSGLITIQGDNKSNYAIFPGKRSIEVVMSYLFPATISGLLAFSEEYPCDTAEKKWKEIDRPVFYLKFC